MVRDQHVFHMKWIAYVKYILFLFFGTTLWSGQEFPMYLLV